MSLVSGKADIRDRDVTFEEHLQQVMSIMSWRMRNTTEKAILYSYTLDFILMRCYRKLFAGLQIGVTLWFEHPLVALRDFYEKRSRTDAKELTSASASCPVWCWTPCSGEFSNCMKHTYEVLSHRSKEIHQTAIKPHSFPSQLEESSASSAYALMMRELIDKT